MKKISIRDTYKGKTILLAGATGFLGKVWLSMALDRLPEIKKIYVLLRRRGSRNARERFELMVNTIQAFSPLHEKHGKNLSQFLADHVEVLEGDISETNLGLEVETVKRLQKTVDLVINSAGLVDFNPDVRFSIAANVQGPLNVLEFVRGCEHAALQHVSTCYVSGLRKGRVPETIESKISPRGLPFDGEAELKDVSAMLKQIELEHESPETEARVQEELKARNSKNGNNSNSESGQQRRIQLIRKKLLKESMVAEGSRRVAKWGYSDIYTYTKGLAEALLVQRGQGVRLSIVRPAIIESAMDFPFPGWNEGFNTSGPLAYLVGTWFRYLPTRVDHPLDVIPVDMVCRAMMAVGAALLEDQYESVYHCGTSDKQVFPMGRVCELTQLSHRTYLREHGSNFLERTILSRWDAIPSPVTHPLALRRLRKAVGWSAERLRVFSPTSKFFVSRWLARLAGMLNRIVRRIVQVEEVLSLFHPYILDVHRNFETDALQRLDLEEAEYRFAPEDLSWRKYWINIHMPGLRRWCFPVIEGKPRELYQPEFPVHMPKEDEKAPHESKVLGNGAGENAPKKEATI